ncbi:hypothetical protein HMPREF7215_0138 [Pyramidobacter piscolens W5455]|uniref:Uncharacterized protein n=1 Tax=Pyramidobacter piscolens W5455 TaxID=352165 RepID=A0ABM9ZRB6_9BACT|nr:hypothetical protein HMPREF7215_0138 [Pyramidobacter piscolens W5455]
MCRARIGRENIPDGTGIMGERKENKGGPTWNNFISTE